MINPWAILIVILSVLGGFGSGYFKGSKDERLKQQMEIAQLNNEARIKEQALVSAVNTQATTLRKQQDEAKTLIQKRNADITNGSLKLRVLTKTSCPIPAATDTAIAARDSVQATVELDPTTARNLVAITDQGDANTRQLNACIDAYNTVYQTLKGKP